MHEGYRRQNLLSVSSNQGVDYTKTRELEEQDSETSSDVSRKDRETSSDVGNRVRTAVQGILRAF